jgi:hypothetical protein
VVPYALFRRSAFDYDHFSGGGKETQPKSYCSSMLYVDAMIDFISRRWNGQSVLRP